MPDMASFKGLSALRYWGSVIMDQIMIAPASDPLLQESPIRRTKLYEQVAAKIEDLIRSGELKPGDRLPSERDIMAAYSIGRPAVREAFLTLASKGLITIENGRRARVRLPSMATVLSTLGNVVELMIADTSNLRNLFEARIFIEAAMARHAATAIDTAHLDLLKARLEENRKAIGSRSKFVETDIAFHRVLFHTANNPLFDAIHTALVGWLMERWVMIKRTKATETLAYEGHREIYMAVNARDPDAAETAMRQHLASSWMIWAAQLGEARL